MSDSTNAIGPWIRRPWIDLLVGCGGWSLPLLLVSYTLVDRDVPRWSAVFYALALVCNYPHYMATIYRAYGRDDRGEYRLYTHYLTAALVVVAAAAHGWFALVPWLFTAYVMWSPWHYTGQNFGLLMMFLRRAGVEVTDEERRRVRIAFVASFAMLIAAFNAGPSRDPLVLSIGLPAAAAGIMEVGAGLVFVVALVSAILPIARRAGLRPLVAPLTLCTTQALWFVVPIVLGWIAPFSLPQTRYSSGVLAIMHSAQYLWITRYFAERDAERRLSPRPWSARAYWVTLVAGGAALFLPVPWIASYVGHLDFTASVFIVAAAVNLHHFMIDGVVWKLRHPRVGQVLVGEGSESRAATATVTAAAVSALEPAARVRWRSPSWRAVAMAGAVALIALAGVDVWRYLLSVSTSDRTRLEAAATINPYDSGTYLRLAQAARAAGDLAGAEVALRRAMAASPQNPAPAQALQRMLIDAGKFQEAYVHVQAMIARWPNDVDTIVNAGVLAGRLGDRVAAAKWWRRALDRDPSLLRVHLYLAELIDGTDRAADALAHYRAYLELVTRVPAADRPAPGEVVPVVVKFGDALARQGERNAALLQYDLAIRMAQQTGLADLERQAAARRGAMGR